jgi:hypothetical protein
MKKNCLIRALDQWVDNKDIFRLWYNSNHVITLERWFDGRVLTDDDSMSTYLPLSDYGFVYFKSAFGDWLTPKYRKLLLEYLDSLRDDEIASL